MSQKINAAMALLRRNAPKLASWYDHRLVIIPGSRLPTSSRIPVGIRGSVVSVHPAFERGNLGRLAYALGYPAFVTEESLVRKGRRRGLFSAGMMNRDLNTASNLAYRRAYYHRFSQVIDGDSGFVGDPETFADLDVSLAGIDHEICCWDTMCILEAMQADD